MDRRILFSERPGQGEIQSDLFYDYRTNVDSYPKWQAWMRENQPRLLVVWGKYETSFDPGEPEHYRKDVPKAEVHVVDGGHFALDTAADEITRLVRDFMASKHAELEIGAQVETRRCQKRFRRSVETSFKVSGGKSMPINKAAIAINAPDTTYNPAPNPLDFIPDQIPFDVPYGTRDTTRPGAGGDCRRRGRS